jgi:phage repressor protein C with HTH and peptisase S24 domain
MSNQFNLSFTVKGNDLAPRLRDGERVIVDTRLKCDVDDEVVAIAKDGTTTVLCIDSLGDGRIYFQSVNGNDPFNLPLKSLKAMYVVVAIQCAKKQVRYD